jgi:Fe-S oxidoreductase
MVADGVFEGASAAHARLTGVAGNTPPLTLAWAAQSALAPAAAGALHGVYLGAYLAHEVVFFFLLCYRPFGIQFHVETSLLSVWFAKLDRGTVKPVRWGVPEAELDRLGGFGAKGLEDFTWKHILDFYSCADCGRCSEMCPSDAVGRPLAPRTFSVRARDYVFRHYPVFGATRDGDPLVGGVITEDQIWSCTTCGACEAECPLLVEYIDKIVDLRRGLIDSGKAPQSLHKPLKALETRGNPYGKPEKKRGEWAQGAIPVVNGTGGCDALYFVDSVTSYDERMQAIGRSAARILARLGLNAAILGPKERDSGHEVRRFGEETLFFALRDHNTAAIRATGASRVVVTDPHALNALRHDYPEMPPVEHISEVVARAARSGLLKFQPANGDVFAYHDPCYLGRHNGVYDAPRMVLDSIPNLKRVEMDRCRDRSFCCGGGGLSLFYEPKEQERMGVRRVRMAAEAGANVVVTACPFCLANLEDAIKVEGMEDRMSAVDLTELIDRQLPT